MARGPSESGRPARATTDVETVAERRAGPNEVPARAGTEPPLEAQDAPAGLVDRLKRSAVHVSRGSRGSSMSLTTMADALLDDEVRRTRQFIMMGWLVSIGAIVVVPFVDAPRAMAITYIAAMVWGMVMSFYFWLRFADPSRYGEKPMLTLAMLAIINAHVAILFLGLYSIGPAIMVIGIHFAARSEAERAARYIFATGVICYAIVSSIVITGLIDDPGVFDTDIATSRLTLAAGSLSVLGVYALAYYTARALRRASRHSIESLQNATRLASQRKALMDELRADLERALRVGGPGRHTDQVVGSFKLGFVLGRGAMGEVYEAANVTTNEPAAVKLLRRELLADPTHVARFLRESKASGALASPYVVRVLEAAAPDDGVPYLAMERLVGHTLAELLRQESRLAVEDVASSSAGHVGAGVDAASEAGIVHRDLKPQNLFRSDGPATQWKILDFGVATLADDSGTLTQGGIVGTPSYMAPEQAQGARVDGRADVYAVAAVAYRCLTGRHPFIAPRYAVAAVRGRPSDAAAAERLRLVRRAEHRSLDGPSRSRNLRRSVHDRRRVRRRIRARVGRQPREQAPQACRRADRQACLGGDTVSPTQGAHTNAGSHFLRTTLTTAADALRTEEVERTRTVLAHGDWPSRSRCSCSRLSCPAIAASRPSCSRSSASACSRVLVARAASA